MHEIRLDAEKNRLYIVLKTVIKGEGETIHNRIVEAVSNLQKGFTIIADISEFIPSEPSEVYYVDIILKLLAEAGLYKAVRVTGRPVKRRVESVTENGYLLEVAETLEDAERYLEVPLPKEETD